MAEGSLQVGSLVFRVWQRRIPLINTACPWASEKAQLKELYASDSVGLTTRTAVVKAGHALDSIFEEDLNVHTVRFVGDQASNKGLKWSLNSYGYSPHPLQYYLGAIEELFADKTVSHKPVLISITGSPQGVGGGIEHIHKWAAKNVEHATERIGIEVNLSCPNITGTTIPSGYDAASISEYIKRIQEAVKSIVENDQPALTVGLKLPPYTYEAQYIALIAALEGNVDTRGQCGVHFLTATNTLGSSFWFDDQNGSLSTSLPVSNEFTGFGGLAGAALHPLALENVRRHRTLLDASRHASVRTIRIIGAGGVDSLLAARRMVAAGAELVGLATALGQKGSDVFAEILAQGNQA